MAVHTLYPGFVKLTYTGAGRNHVATFPIRWSGTPVATEEPSFLTKANEPILMSDALDDLALIMKPLLANADSILYATAWNVPSQGADPLFIYQYDMGVAGTGGSSSTPASQAVASYRTATGNKLRVYVMEGALTPDQVYRPPATGTIMTWANWFKGNTSWVVGRDLNPAISLVGVVTKINDKLRRAYLLS